MKLERLIVQFLYTNKKVTIQDIGTFTLSPDIIIPEENDKHNSLPPNSIHFEADLKAPQDEDLIDFITKQTRKIRPLAASDLESYSMLNKQFLNIGKPLVIEGLGTLQKNQLGQFSFSQTTIIQNKIEAAPVQKAEKNSEEISFSSTERITNRSSKNSLQKLLILILLLAAGTVVFYFLKYKENNEDLVVVKEPAQPLKNDTIIKVDTSLTQKIDSVLPKPTNPIPAEDGTTFSVVIKEYASLEAADKAYNRLTRYGHQLKKIQIDSIRYKLAMPFKTDLSDTTRAKDSLSKFFQSKTYIILP